MFGKQAHRHRTAGSDPSEATFPDAESLGYLRELTAHAAPFLTELDDRMLAATPELRNASGLFVIICYGTAAADTPQDHEERVVPRTSFIDKNFSSSLLGKDFVSGVQDYFVAKEIHSHTPEAPVRG